MSGMAPVPVSNGTSKKYRLTFINEYDKEQSIIAYYNEIDDRWVEHPSGKPVNEKIIKTEEL